MPVYQKLQFELDGEPHNDKTSDLEWQSKVRRMNNRQMVYTMF